MTNQPLVFSISRAYLRRLALFLAGGTLCFAVGVVAIYHALGAEQHARALAVHPVSWLPTWTLPWGIVGLCVLSAALTLLVVPRAIGGGRPVLTIDDLGITIQRPGSSATAPPYFVPWDHVTSVRRPAVPFMNPLHIELVSEHHELHAQSLGLTGWAARKARFHGPVVAQGPSSTPTITLMPASLGIERDELEALIEQRRAAARLADGGRTLLPRR